MTEKDQETAGPQAVADGDDMPDAPQLEESMEEGAVAMEDDAAARAAEHEARIATLEDRLLRSEADMQNLRKRHDRELENARKFGISNFASDLLTAADNLGRALDAFPADLDRFEEKTRTLVAGVQMTERELQNAFTRNGIRKIDPIGAKFDYNFHQALFEAEATDNEPGTVIHVLQPGYILNDRVLRPASVGVAKAPVTLEAQADEATDDVSVAPPESPADGSDQSG